jgi:RecA-family ATPase
MFDNDDDDRDYHGNGYLHGERRRGRKVCEYIYRHADGNPYLRVERFTVKPESQERDQFPQSHWDNGVWVSDPPPGLPIPYRLPQLLKAALSEPVISCEGEKDADNLAALGFVTTCNPGGAGKWHPALNKWFEGRPQVILPEDNDEAGRDHVLKVASALRGIVPDIRVIDFRDMHKGADPSDWIARGGTREQMLELIKNARPVIPPLTFVNIAKWDHEPVPEQQWTVLNKIPREQVALFSGEGGMGKSHEGLHLCAAHSIGGECWLTAVERGPSIFIDAEDNVRVLHIRLAAIAEHYGVSFADLVKGGLHIMSLVGQDAVLATCSRKGAVEPTTIYSQLLQAAGDIKPVQIVIASSANVFGGNENDRHQVQVFVGNLLTKVALTAGGSVTLIAHPSVRGVESGSGISGSTQWHNSVRARIYMKGVKPAEDELPDTGLRELTFQKNQYGEIGEKIVLRWQNGLYVPEPGTATLDQAEHEAKAEGVFIELLRRLTSENRLVSHKVSVSYAPAVFAREPEAKAARLDSRALAAAMTRLFKAGVIWNEPHGKASRPAFHIAIKTEF